MALIIYLNSQSNFGIVLARPGAASIPNAAIQYLLAFVIVRYIVTTPPKTH